MTETITRFDGDYRFLSNFYPSPIEVLGNEYPTVEHVYQSWKAKNFADWEYVALSETPAVAKRRGREIDCREDWDEIKIEVMEYCLRKKFEDPVMLEMLISTFPIELVEGNWWGDTFWGVCNGKGKNHLGKLLMKIRLEGVLSGSVCKVDVVSIDKERRKIDLEVTLVPPTERVTINFAVGNQEDL